MALPEIIGDPGVFRRRCDEARSRGKRVALVPTMGALHEGHLRLVDEAARRADLVAVSIFVNPTQFGPREDLARYPRDLDGDVAKLAGRQADLVLAPCVDDVYRDGACTTVTVGSLTEHLCGAHRPGHFAGVATVVCKLFNMTGPCVALFGRKDYQQLQVIRRMVADLDMPVEVVGVPTVREADGLAMSSRNAYLSVEERARASAIPAALTAAHARFEDGERDILALLDAVGAPLLAACDSIDYVSAADPDSLVPIPAGAPAPNRLLVALAVRVGTTRLIDNTVLGEDHPPLHRGIS